MAEPMPVSDQYVWEKAYPADVDWHAPLPQRPLFEILDEALARFADNPCTDFMGKVLTYRQIGDLVSRAAKGFQDMGVGPGVKVGLFLPNTPYSIICYHAVLKCGGIVVNFNPLYGDKEVARQIEDSETGIMVTLDVAPLYDKLMRLFDVTPLKTLVMCRMSDILPFPKDWLFPIVKFRDKVRIPKDRRHVRFDRLIANDGAYRPVEVKPADLAVLQYTGGTTGEPKGAMLTHGNLSVNVAQATMWFTTIEPGRETVLAVLPFFHVFAMTAIMNTALSIGASLILIPRFKLDETMKVIDRKKPTVLPGVPTIFGAINAHPERDRYDLSSLRLCLSGGSSLPHEVRMAFERASGCQLGEGYGLTEASPVICATPFDGRVKPGSIGLPLPGTIVEIVSLDDPGKVLPPGERGEICARGPQVMQAYWRKPDATAQALADGRLHTGDVGYMDEEGWVFIVDRIKDIIIASGYNIYPRNVEEAIYEHPAVEECVVAGVPDPYRGQTVKAFVKLKRGQSLTLEDLKDFLSDRLSPMEIPKQLNIRDELPRTMVGKLSRKALLEEEEKKRTEGQS